MLPQADILWQNEDGQAKFIFTLQAHGVNHGQEYSRFLAEGNSCTALPKLEPAAWQQVSAYVRTFMSRMGSLGYSMDLRVPGDVNDPGLPDDTCRFGCGTDENMLRQLHNAGGLPAGPPLLFEACPPESWNTNFVGQQVNGIKRGLRWDDRPWRTRSGLCNIDYDGRARSMLIYQFNDPPVRSGKFHQLHELPSWLVPFAYQDIILDMKERFPYLQAYTITANFGTWNANDSSNVHFKVTSTEREGLDFIYERWNSYKPCRDTADGRMLDEKSKRHKYPRDFKESRPRPGAWPQFDQESAPDAEEFATKAAEIRQAVILEMQQEHNLLLEQHQQQQDQHVDNLAQQMGNVNI